MITDFENSLPLETSINCLQNKYNTSRHLLQTSLQYHVKHKSLTNAFVLPVLNDKAVNSTINFFTLKEIHYFTYLLLTALSSNACTNYKFTKLRNCWTFSTAFNRVQLTAQLMESAPSRVWHSFVIKSRIDRANALFKIFMFHTVVQRVFKEVARSIVFILQIIYCCFQQ